LKHYKFENLIDSDINTIAESLSEGKIMLYPTDTVAGIGCIVSNQRSVDKINIIKKRDRYQPLSYAFSSLKMMEDYVNLSSRSRSLINHYLPGKLTLVLFLKKSSPECFGFNNKDNSIGCRIIDNPSLNKIIEKTGEPIISTSANISNSPPAKDFDKIDQNILNAVDIILEWRYPLSDTPSTVVTEEDNKILILREGTISSKEIERIILSKK
jgi:L-threonylcarbamoyladenylate synthase